MVSFNTTPDNAPETTPDTHCVLLTFEYTDGTVGLDNIRTGCLEDCLLAAQIISNSLVIGEPPPGKIVKELRVRVITIEQYAQLLKASKDGVTRRIEKVQEEFLQAYTEFKANDKSRTQWIYIDHENAKVSIYLRKSQRRIKGRLVKCIDIANISVEPCGMGIGSMLINTVHQYNPYEATYIENVFNERFADHLYNQGWLRQRELCFYKLCEGN